MFQDYPLAVALLMAGWIASRRRDTASMAASGLLMGAAGVTNYAFFLYGATVGGIALWRRLALRERPVRFALAWAAGAALPTVALLDYNTHLFGGPLTTAYAYMLDEGQRIAHAHVGFSFEALVRSLVGPRHGIFFVAPWTVLGAAGLGLAARDPRRQWTALAGIAVGVTVLGFSSVWETSNADDMAFNRHVMAVFPWLAWGLGYLVRRVLDGASVWGSAGLGLAGAGMGIGWFYALATSWTFPYHAFQMATPLWQINVPLFLNGGHVPSILYHLFSPWAVPGREAAGDHWVAVLATVLAAAGAVALARAVPDPAAGRVVVLAPGDARAAARLRMRPWALAAALMGGLYLFVGVGLAGSPVTPDVREWADRVTPEERASMSPQQRDLWRRANQERRFYESALTDILGSSFTPQDVSWSDAGFPGTNRWCDSPESRVPSRLDAPRQVR
jgi:hypothetical protein